MIDALRFTSTPVATLLSVVTLLFTGHPITPTTVFMLVSLLNVLNIFICVFVAVGFLGTYDAYVSLGRIQDFLLLENLPTLSRDQALEEPTNTESLRDQSIEHPSNAESSSTKFKSVLTDHLEKMKTASNTNQESHREDPTMALHVSSLTYRNIKRKDGFILQDIEFTIASKSLTVITGPVGSGKSTLLSAIAGELSEIQGTISCPGTLVYVPQTPWVFSGTIRENILFGQPYDEPKYTRITEVCALKEDMQQFPDHDQTVVGERGEVLSGGQQARVSLARAVYADADLYLLDDPLSAVDYNVGQHIFENCIKGLLRDKTRVLTSHQEQHMKEADQVTVLFKGRILEKGSFTEIQEKGVLNSTIDPLFKSTPKDRTSADSFGLERAEKSKVPETGCETMVPPLPNKAKNLQISQEDRTIGVVSYKLYWEYFRSGMHWLVIFAVIVLCLTTEGKF